MESDRMTGGKERENRSWFQALREMDTDQKKKKEEQRQKTQRREEENERFRSLVNRNR